MNASDDSRRIGLPGSVFAKLTAEVDSIKKTGEHFKVNEAKLAAAIIDLYFERHVETDRSRIEKTFFDKKSYLKTLIDKSATDDDLSSSIHEYLQMSKGKRKPKTPEPDLPS